MRNQKTILSKIYISLFALCCSACSFPGGASDHSQLAEDPKAIAYLQWLKGKWKTQLKEGTLFESWKRGEGDMLSGSSQIISGTDTLWSESMLICNKGGELNLSVKGNDTSDAVLFRFVAYDKGEFVFANMDNKYPQRIIYKNPQPDFLCVRLEGTVDGKLRKEDFSFVRTE